MDRLETVPTRSLLTYLLVKADREHRAADDGSSFPEFYATVLLPELV